MTARDAALTARDATLAERDRAVFALATERDRRTSSLADLAAFRERAARASAAADAGTRESVLSLVQTKVLVQKVLLSDVVLAEYPDLADRLDRYLEALVTESRGDAEIETLRDLDGVLADLAAGEGAVVPDEVVARRTAGGQQDLLLRHPRHPEDVAGVILCQRHAVRECLEGQGPGGFVTAPLSSTCRLTAKMRAADNNLSPSSSRLHLSSVSCPAHPPANPRTWTYSSQKRLSRVCWARPTDKCGHSDR